METVAQMVAWLRECVFVRMDTLQQEHIVFVSVHLIERSIVKNEIGE